jgi:hypothetical protein
MSDMDVEEAVRVVQTYRGAILPTLHEVVDQRILGTIAYILAVGEGLRVDHGVEGEAISRPHPSAPVESLELAIELVGIRRSEGSDRQEDTQGGAQAVVRLVEELLVSGEGDHTAPFLYICRSEGF